MNAYDYTLEAALDYLVRRLADRPVDVRVVTCSNLYLVRVALADGSLLETLVDRDADADDLPWLVLSAAEVRVRVAASVAVAWCRRGSVMEREPLSLTADRNGPRDLLHPRDGNGPEPEVPTPAGSGPEPP